MASRNASIAEAAKSALNAAATDGQFLQTFTAKRVYVPFNELDALSALTVSIYCSGDASERLDRIGTDRHEITVDIGVQKKLSTTADPSTEDANAEIDALVELAEQIADFFGPGDYAGAGWLKTEHTVLADPNHLYQKRAFTSVITLTFLYAN